MDTLDPKNYRNAGMIVAVLGVALVTLALLPLRGTVNATTVGFLQLAVVIFVATYYEWRAALTASVLAAFSFNFFFLPPYHVLTIDDPQNWVALFVFLILAITVGRLASTSNKRRAEAERLYRELEEAFERASQTEAIKRSEKLKSALLDAVTHDLRTPLTTIKAAATMLRQEIRNESIHETLDPEGREELLEAITEETEKLNAFIDAMVGLARVQAGETAVEKAPVSADEIVSKAAQRARSALASHVLHRRIDPDLPLVSVDPRATVEVLYNLLDNAAKYSPAKTTITVSADLFDGKVRFSVEDEGDGIPESERKAVFEKFHRAHRTPGGLGLGLSIARGIVEAHDGKIWIESGAKGTRFVFELPIVTNGNPNEDPGR
ncbi:MAG: DUF4118 domain-containing protein [Chloracidobacterium sp.]|nr:DUF4118 domain-containing protein [Chloracidobacterium sp.]